MWWHWKNIYIYLVITCHTFGHILHIWKMDSYFMLHRYFFDKLFLFVVLLSMYYRNKWIFVS